MKSNLKILVVEDDPIIADDICACLIENEYTSVNCAFNYDEAIAQLSQNQFDFVFLDINLNSKHSGINLAIHINENYLIPFCYITSYADVNTIQEVKKTFPVGYIVKPFNQKEIPIVIEIGLENFYKPQLKQTISIQKINKITTSEISQREYDVILKMLDGKNNTEISNELFVSINTIKSHLKNIFVKLNVRSRSEAISVINNI